VVLKPSELCKATQDLFVELIPKYMDTSAIKVITGGADETGQLLNLKWDKIFYTGGSKVARIIASAAAKNLTPVTLELGGQDPVIVGKSANIDLAAKRIANAKFTNAGQVCVNANHIFADPAIHDKLVERLIYWNKEFTKTGGSLASIVNERHFDRITNLVKGTKGDVVYTGDSNREKRYIHPTVVKDVQLDDSLMSEEIFGPIVPVLSSTVDEAIRVVNSMPHALALYIFSNDKAEIDKILNATTSGGVTVNDVMIHVAVPGAPFGGVGESGNGAQNGKFTFDAFSHTRTVLTMPGWMDRVLSFRYPPFDMSKVGMAKVKGGSLVGKRGQTMEEQTVGGGFNASGVVGRALLVTAVLLGLDRASGGKLLVGKYLGDVVQRIRA
jgi:aldehyde dehydrogenase (NAD+)